METLIASLVSGGLALLGTIVTINASNQRTQQVFETKLAVIETKIETLSKEVAKHNGFAERIPRLETLMSSTVTKVQQLENFHME